MSGSANAKRTIVPISKESGLLKIRTDLASSRPKRCSTEQLLYGIQYYAMGALFTLTSSYVRKSGQRIAGTQAGRLRAGRLRAGRLRAGR